MASSKHVCIVTVIDPDTNLPCDVEIRKLEGGALVGLDASWLEQCEGDANNPYDWGKVEVPDDEETPADKLAVLILSSFDGKIHEIINVPYSLFTGNVEDDLNDLAEEYNQVVQLETGDTIGTIEGIENWLRAKNDDFETGERVWWTDPDEEIGGVSCSGWGKIVEINGDVVSIAKEDGGEVEAPKEELSYEQP